MAVDQTHERDVVLDIEGMTCASCVNRIERVLQRHEGVAAARVNLASHTATVRTTLAAPDALIRAVERAGYGARPHERGLDARGEGADYARRLVVSAALTVPILALTFGVGASWATWAAWALATPVQFYGGWPFIRAAARAARHGTSTMDTLVAVGSLAAYGYSAWAVATDVEGHYFDTAAVI
ncbi:MAG TPA: cation transporter, partial [Actinomycetota bacterium]|nr:cation transporter [Actinomycetota bacterium]